MNKKTRTTLGASLALGLGASALAVMTPAHAATTSTATIHGTTVFDTGSAPVWFDTGTATAPTPDQNRTVTLTAIADGPDIDFTLNFSKGPQAGSVAGVTPPYALDAYVRLDGAPNAAGKRFSSAQGTAAVDTNSSTFPGGVAISGSFINAGLGAHTLTLNKVVLDVDAGGGVGTEPASFDTVYNAGLTRDALINNPVDWPLAEAVTVGTAPVADTTKPVAKLKAPKKAAAKKGSSWKVIRGTLTDDRGVKSANVKVVTKTAATAKAKAGWKFFKGNGFKQAASKKKALKKAATLSSAPNAAGAWSVRVGKKAPKGTLHVQYWGIDAADNASAKKILKQKITK